ncbi:hypothetical protein [Maridesulfovibrio sp.]|uniref:hypothetical protein n=1 Tax=Maridesulfovibrio sp. TaxID=2795000 RepID=UPI0029C9CA1C|nr:hypothetical protein [Maridesulfovibrio sp.]
MNRKNIPLIFSACFLVVSTAVILVSFGNYFDISDEGLAAYLSLFGEQAIWPQQFHYITHAWGDFFGHSLLVYRLLYFVMVFLECFVFTFTVYVYYNISSHKDKLLFFLNLFFCSVAVQFIFAVFTTPSYDSYAAFGAFLWASMFLLVLTDCGNIIKNLAISLLASASILIALMAKPATGLAFVLGILFLLPCFRYFLSMKIFNDSVWSAYLGLVIGAGLFILVLGDDAARVAEIYGSLGGGDVYSLPKLLARHIRDIFLFTLYAGCYLVLWFFLFRLLKRGTVFGKLFFSLLFAALLVFTFGHIRPLPTAFYHFDVLGLPISKLLPSTIDTPKAKMITYMVSLGLAVLLFGSGITKRLTYNQRKDVLFFLVIFFAALAAYAGTAANLNWHMHSVAGLVAALPAVFYLLRLSHSECEIKAFAFPLLAFVVLGLSHQYNNVLAHYYRCPPLGAQNSVSKSSQFLKNVNIDSDRAEMIDHISKALDKVEFNRSQDSLYVYPAAPGLLAAVNAKAFGSLWSTTKLIDFDCYSFSAEKKRPDANVYILRGGDVPPKTKTCFLERLKPANNYKLVPLGDYFNFRQGEVLRYYLEGPYIFF